MVNEGIIKILSDISFKMDQQLAFFSCFERGELCVQCGLMCHHDHRQSHPLRENSQIVAIVNTHSLADINRMISSSAYQLESVAHPEYTQSGLIIMMLAPQMYSGVQHMGQSPLLMSGTTQVSSIPRTVVQSKQFRDGDYTTYEKVPVYETVTKHREEKYREEVPGPKAGPVKYNTTSRVYTNYDSRSKSYGSYHDVSSYETKWQTLPKQYVDKVRKVAYDERVFKEYKDVAKSTPHYKTVTEEKVVYDKTYTTIPTFYYLIPRRQKCEQCQCSRCTSIFACIYFW